jgi:hypothetical protein
LASVQLFNAHAKGNFADADRAIQRTLRLSRDLQPRGMMVSQLVSINFDSAAMNAFVTLTLLPNVDVFLGAVVRHQAHLAGVECLTAVRRYALRHGSLPENLEVATREAGLKAVPTDPYSGGPMHYKVIDGKPVVYSVGSDGKDDGGTVDWEYGKKPGDFIFRIRE